MPDASTELQLASADIALTRDAREILDRAAELATKRGSLQVAPADVLNATLELPRSLADREIQEMGFDPKAIAAQLPANGTSTPALPLRQLLVNANREAQVLGHYQVDSIHLLLVMLYSDSPTTSAPLMKAGLTLYDLRRHLQNLSQAAPPTAAPPPRDQVRREKTLRRRPWPSLKGVLSVSPFFLGTVGVTALAGAALWADLVPRSVPLLTLVFVVGGWITSLCIHEFGHAIVAYLGGDRSVAAAGYLSLNPLRYQNLLMSLILPVVFLLLGGIAMPGGAVYINHSALRTRAWSSAVALAGPVGSLLCALVIAGVFWIAGQSAWITNANANFFAALALLGFFLVLAVLLNLLPVPGLDGFGVIRPWLPYSVQLSAMRYSTVAIYGVFIVLWFVAPVRSAFFQAVFQIAASLSINPTLIVIGQLNMRFF
jgi:Zn-dependent protease